tara:strand:+ start:931 stop:1209 length:279 start_codon:yes stop_codon:yes gene_type:complete
MDKKKKPLNKPFKAPAGSKKKFQVYVKTKDGKTKLVSFGARGMPDFRSGTATKEQRKSFLARMKGVKRKDGSFAYKDKTSPAYWSVKFLWAG